MDFLTLTRLIATGGLALGAAGLLLQLKDILNRPFRQDLSQPRGSERRGILYAFTLGMAPWEKESTRIHWLAYLRGIAFHTGIFSAFGLLLVSPWLENLPQPIRWVGMMITGLGALAGFAGIAMRRTEPNLRALSLPDDYFSVFLTSLFIALAFLVLLTPAALPYFYLVTAALSVYVPLSKIRHCAYFFYSKFFFGKTFGRRGVIGQTKGNYAE